MIIKHEPHSVFTVSHDPFAAVLVSLSEFARSDGAVLHDILRDREHAESLILEVVIKRD